MPLLRPGFRPDGPYAVTFVYLHAGTPFGKKGDMQMTLPKMDLPVSVVEWELFVPDRFRADRFDGNVLAANLVEEPSTAMAQTGSAGASAGGAYQPSAPPGQIIGRIVDQTGMALPGATIVAEGAGQRRTAVTDVGGTYVMSQVPSGPIAVTSRLQGFDAVRRSLVYDQRPRQVDFVMQVGALSETVTVTCAVAGTRKVYSRCVSFTR